MPNKNRAKTKSVRKFFSSKNLIWYALGIILLVVILAITTFSQNSTKKSSSLVSACGPYRNDKTVQMNGETFKAEVPNSLDAEVKGLAGRPCILPNQAMLFEFNKNGQHRFWMKDMKFPIDIVWISEDFKVAGVEKDVEPSTYFSKNPVFVNDPDHLAKYVLELNANRSTDLHLTLGTPVRF